MKRLFSPSFMLMVAIGLSTGASSALAQEGTYLNSDQIDLSKLLAPPPALGTAKQSADLDHVLKVQRERTPEQVERAKGDLTHSVFRFADVLGPSFNEAKLPKTTALFKVIGDDAGLVTKPGKKYFNRPRPFVTSNDVSPTVPTGRQSYYWSYPSGHATYGYLCAILLAQMVPEKSARIFARGREYGQNRVVDGVHYPTDIEAGRIDGTLIAAALMQNPKFQRDFAVAKTEVRTALGLN
jgi:acid phosphatase (class A)